MERQGQSESIECSHEEDTNDLSNYDTAEKKLRDYRTKFRAYRGNGGIINEVRDKHLTLENQKDQAEQQKPRLQDIVEEIEQLNREKTAKTEDVSVLREKIRRASHQKARQVTQRHLGELRTDISKNQQYLHEICIMILQDSYGALKTLLIMRKECLKWKNIKESLIVMQTKSKIYCSCRE